MLDNRIDLDGFDVLELGCGTGLSGIFCALQTRLKHVFLTDYCENIVTNARINISHNNRDTNASAHILDWTNPSLVDHKLFMKKFDRIIATDICYDVESSILASKTLEHCCAQHGQVFVVLPVRYKFGLEMKTFENSMQSLSFSREIFEPHSFIDADTGEVDIFHFYTYRRQ